MTRLAAYPFALVALFVALLLPAGVADAEQHELTLERVRPVGAKYQVRVQGEQTQKQTQSLNGQQVGGEERKLSGALTAVAEILAVHENKQVRSVAIRVEKFEGAAGEKAITLDTAKRIIVSAVDGDTTFKYEDGTAIGEDAAEVLGILAMFMVDEDPEDASDDKMFKLDQPREKGSKWECDNELLAKDIASGGELVIDKDGIESEFEFLDIAEFAGQKAAVFDVSVQLRDFSVPGAKEQGLNIIKSKGEMNMSGLLPLDPESGDGAMQVQMEMDVVAEVKIDQGTVRLGFEITGEADAEYREIK